MSEELSRRQRHAAKKSAKQREKERIAVEKAYAKEHPPVITVVTPETRREMRLTRKGKYELGSDGQLTENGKIARLKYRYNWGIALVVIAIIALYAYFFLVK